MPEHDTLGEYLILEYLARGSHSDVFLALKLGPGQFCRPVVIKALPSRYQNDDDFVELFYREAFVSSRLDHPNCVTVHDARLIESVPCIIMDLIPGQTVADIAQKGFRQGDLLSSSQSLRIVSDAARGLHHAHRFSDWDGTVFQLIHRDVSPQNLMVTYDGKTKLFDFGIAKVKRGEQEMTLMQGGKFAYMSPEQCLGDELDRRSDIFSLGIVLYELITKQRLFRRPDQDSTIKAVTEETIPQPKEYNPDISDQLEEVIMTALKRDRTRRFESAKAFGKALEDCIETKTEKLRKGIGRHVKSLFDKQRIRLQTAIRQASSMDFKVEQIGKNATETQITIGVSDKSRQAESAEINTDLKQLLQSDRAIWVGAGAVLVVIAFILFVLTF